MRLLIAEDDPQLGNLLVRGLRERAFAVDLVTDGKHALYQAAMNEYDAMILDVMMPPPDGLEVARALRARGSHVPILLLTARDAITDRVAGLDAGGDDYVTKPFAWEELLARLRALLRRGHQVIPDLLTVGDLRIDTRRQLVTRGGRALALTAKEYAVLEYLARRAGEVVTRVDLTGHVWDDNHDPLSNTLEVHINRLRRKLEAAGEQPMIHTRRGAGYVLDAGP